MSALQLRFHHDKPGCHSSKPIISIQYLHGELHRGAHSYIVFWQEVRRPRTRRFTRSLAQIHLSSSSHNAIHSLDSHLFSLSLMNATSVRHKVTGERRDRIQSKNKNVRKHMIYWWIRACVLVNVAAKKSTDLLIRSVNKGRVYTEVVYSRVHFTFYTTSVV